jgi:hypothetical protein
MWEGFSSKRARAHKAAYRPVVGGGVGIFGIFEDITTLGSLEPLQYKIRVSWIQALPYLITQTTAKLLMIGSSYNIDTLLGKEMIHIAVNVDTAVNVGQRGWTECNLKHINCYFWNFSLIFELQLTTGNWNYGKNH